MRKKLGWMASICVLVSVFMLSGCLFTLKKPILELPENSFELTWQKQDNVKDYEVNINDTIFEVEENKFDLAPYLGVGIQNIQVKAVSDNLFTNDSDWSDKMTLVMGETQLATPQISGMPTELNGYTLSWGDVANADMYVVGIKPKNGKETFVDTTKNSMRIMDYMTTGGEYELRVRALSYNYVTNGPSSFCVKVDYTCPLPLSQPNNLSLDGKTLTWASVDNATSYRITNEKGTSITSNINSADISSLCESNKAGYFFVQAVSDGSTQDSAYSDGIGIYPKLTSPSMQKQAYGNSKFNFMGQEFDLVIDSKEEMQNLCYYALYYRLTNVDFYVNYSVKVSDAVYTYLSKYNEIKSIQYSLMSATISSSDSIYSLNIQHDHVAMPFKSSAGEENRQQVMEVEPMNYSDVANNSPLKRSETYENFAINEREDEVLVFTTDQLYYALQNGCKPKFGSTTCMAYKAYERAKEILRQIIDNGMTEYERTLAIYEWVVYNSHYDTELLNLSGELEGSRDEAIRNTASQVLSNYKGFYIDGVLFDKGQAVCDGIAKTVVLLCNIEGIECIKVSGDAGGAHAWNKVNIIVPGQTEKKWFTIDATWADIATEDSEYLSHRYFLRRDADMADHTEAPSSDHSSVTAFDYFANTIINEQAGNDIDLYVESLTELENLVNYVLDWNKANLQNRITGIEFKCAENIKTLANNKINIMLTGQGHEVIQDQGNNIFVIIFN